MDHMPLSLIMADIDFFKPFNDNYGHQAGDDSLKLVAAALAECAKKYTDAVIRYGGEEFTVILSHIEKERAAELAEEIRRNVENLKIPHDYSAISKYLTISLGVYTVIPSDELSMDEFIRKADKALYMAKSEERNKVYVF
jgi:diguanylate cyclase (GGDEF)-like protein